MVVRFYLGTHRPNWLATSRVPLFVSRRVLHGRKTLYRASCDWVLDSGGFTELNMYGEWRLTVEEYAMEIQRYQEGIGRLQWAAPMDWMCEPGVLEKTGLTVADHQLRTLENFLRLRSLVGEVVAPVLQGWEVEDYTRHIGMYERCGVKLYREPVVGVGSICRRGQDAEIQRIVRTIKASTPTIRLHAFGVRSDALLALSDILASADSMSWSFEARRKPPILGCPHKSCANCRRYAERWYERTVNALGQTRLETA